MNFGKYDSNKPKTIDKTVEKNWIKGMIKESKMDQNRHTKFWRSKKWINKNVNSKKDQHDFKLVQMIKNNF